MSEQATESEFLDARPETSRRPKGDAEPDSEAGGGDPDLIFLDSVDGEEAPAPAPSSPGGPGRGSDAPSGRSTGRMAKISSGRHKRVSSGRHSTGDDWARRERSESENADALAALVGRAEPEPINDPYIGNDLGAFKPETYLWGDRGERAYIAIDEESKERVLLRVYTLVGAYSAEMRALVTRGERAARVESPALSLCYGSGRTKDCFFVAHELPMGRSLTEILRSGEQLDEREITIMLEQISRGIGTLHAREMVHGDVSPDRIRREKQGSYVLVDAGLARGRPEFSFLAAGGEVLGTPGYIAPETVDSGKIKPSAELYALGCVAWSLVTLQQPFVRDEDGGDPVQILLNQLNEELPPPTPPDGVRSVSAGLATIIGKLTGYTPTVRYRSASELISELRSHAKGETIQPFPPELNGRDQDLELDSSGKALSGGTLLLILLLVLNVAIAGTIGMIYLKSTMIELRDPVAGYHAPIPGISEGGYGPVTPGRNKAGKTGKATSSESKTGADSTAKTAGE